MKPLTSGLRIFPGNVQGAFAQAESPDGILMRQVVQPTPDERILSWRYRTVFGSLHARVDVASVATLAIDFYDRDTGTPYAPSSFSYRIVNTATDFVVRDWTELEPKPTVIVRLTADDTRMVGQGLAEPRALFWIAGEARPQEKSGTFRFVVRA